MFNYLKNKIIWKKEKSLITDTPKSADSKNEENSEKQGKIRIARNLWKMSVFGSRNWSFLEISGPRNRQKGSISGPRNHQKGLANLYRSIILVCRNIVVNKPFLAQFGLPPPVIIASLRPGILKLSQVPSNLPQSLI